MTNDEKLQAKWEKRLEKHGLSELGTYKSMTDNSKGELADSPTSTRTRGRNPDFAKLREIMDGSDTFMDGFQINKIRNRSTEREIPEWAYNDSKVRTLLTLAFPLWKTNKRQHNSAGRWIRIIYLYYRMQLPTQIVTKEMGITKVIFTKTIQRINWAADGYKWNGSEAGKVRLVTHPTAIEVRGEKGDEAK